MTNSLLPKLLILKNRFTIHRLNLNTKIPKKLFHEKYFWIGKTDSELSIACNSNFEINSINRNENWTAIKINEILDFSLVGILAEITKVLAAFKISIFVNSTFETDYFFVKKDDLHSAIYALTTEGYECEYE